MYEAHMDCWTRKLSVDDYNRSLDPAGGNAVRTRAVANVPRTVETRLAQGMISFNAESVPASHRRFALNANTVTGMLAGALARTIAGE